MPLTRTQSKPLDGTYVALQPSSAGTSHARISWKWKTWCSVAPGLHYLPLHASTSTRLHSSPTHNRQHQFWARSRQDAASRCHMLFDISRKGSALFEQASQFCRSTPCAATISAPKASVLIVCSRFTAASLAGSMCPGRYLVVVLASNRCRRTHRNYFVGAGHGLPTPW